MPSPNAIDTALVGDALAGASVADSLPQAASNPAFGGVASQPEFYLDAAARAGVEIGGKPSDTIDQAAAQIDRNEQGWSPVIGEPAVVTYAYRASAPTAMPSDTSGFQPFNSAQIDQAELALKAWSDVANITFVRVGSGDHGLAAYSNNATILLGGYTSGEAGAAAFTYYPGSTAASSLAGDVWVNSSLSYNADPTVGNYGGTALVHELGHAIGLAHPSDYDASATATITYAQNASYYEDSRQYSVMSYFSETNTGGNFAGAYPAAPMLDDIAAAQLEYGANMSTRTGDTIYGFNSNADRPWFVAASATTKLVFAVWDAGGSNTFDFSGYSNNQMIDLRAGDFSNVGGLVGNVAIAQGTTIQSAIGGSGSDLIYGNSANDSLTGGSGDDTLAGGSGASDQLYGGLGNDSITGGNGFNNVNGNQGDDTIVGNSQTGDWLVGGQGNDSIAAHSGAHNILYGNIGNDTLVASSGGDTLRGGQGDDSVVGGAGSDWISGDLGHNTLTGGAGADIFHASAGGIDLVTDFSQAQGDRVQLDAGTSYTVVQLGANTVIELSTGGQMTLAGVSKASLAAGWVFEL